MGCGADGASTPGRRGYHTCAESLASSPPRRALPAPCGRCGGRWRRSWASPTAPTSLVCPPGTATKSRRVRALKHGTSCRAAPCRIPHPAASFCALSPIIAHPALPRRHRLHGAPQRPPAPVLPAEAAERPAVAAPAGAGRLMAFGARAAGLRLPVQRTQRADGGRLFASAANCSHELLQQLTHTAHFSSLHPPLPAGHLLRQQRAGRGRAQAPALHQAAADAGGGSRLGAGLAGGVQAERGRPKRRPHAAGHRRCLIPAHLRPSPSSAFSAALPRPLHYLPSPLVCRSLTTIPTPRTASTARTQTLSCLAF